eukprot:TRINITY_DN3884_c0_g1_i3.p1 TRINITY_DN3884_c0_g1~~TRINITY_DN3884_c0_g1_i3.p1  ORF type:complete len:503 (+),score=139.90 TRINITY_DN3884_c0_g1_i3:34-1509(+)
MEWFSGDVGAAISTAKSKKAIFCVFITGSDENSTKVLEMIENKELSERYKDLVCIKIEQGSTTFSQFSQIYPVLLVPSIFYINSGTGVDLEVTVTTGDEKSIVAGLDRALEKFNSSEKPAESSPSTSSTSQSQPTEEAKEAKVEEEKPKPSESQTTESQDMESRVSRAREMLDETVGVVGPVQSHDTPTPLEDRVSRAKNLMQQRREEKEREEEEKEKRKEMERRNLGRDVQEMQRKQEEQKIQEMVKERQKEKEEERMARARVQAQIEQDRADRAAKFQREKDEREERRKEKERQELAEQAAKADREAAERSTVARLQFRLPDGSSRTHHFPADTTLDEVYKWVSTDLDSRFSNFSLSTTFPRRSLDTQPRGNTLKELQLAPSATIMVLPSSGGSSALTSGDGSLFSFLMLLLSPFTFLWGLVTSFLNPPPASGGNAQQGASQGAAPGAGSSAGGSQPTRPKRGGNIGRLSNVSDDDETNTYNGNSTQQM